jgi:hypothetical protein
MRKYLRQIAKARMAVLGFENINGKFSFAGSDGVKNWQKALYGKTGQQAHDAQMQDGRRRKQAKEARKSIAKRKVKKVQA